MEGLYQILENRYASDIGDLSQLETTDKSSLVGAINEVFDRMYPVGSIYMSVNSTNPSNYFGGTWVSWGSGRVPVGVSSDTEFNTVEKTGGAKSVALDTQHLPSHRHPLGNTMVSDNSGTSSGLLYQTNKGAYPTQYTGNTGGGQAHNNLQPYITCYMFKRTA